MPALDLPPSLTLEGLKLRLDKELSTDDDELGGYLEAAFEQAQAPWPDGCGRLLRPDPALRNTGTPEAPVWQDDVAPVTRTYELEGRRSVVVPDVRFLAPDGVVQDGTVVAPSSLEASGYKLTRHQGHIVKVSVPQGSYGELAVTGRFGFATIPSNLREAIYALAQRYYHERAAMQADAVQLGPGAPPQTYYRQLPPRVRLAFSSFKLPAAIGGL